MREANHTVFKISAAGALVLDELMPGRSVLLMVFFTGLAVMLNLHVLMPRHMVEHPSPPMAAAALFLLPLLLSHISENPWAKKLASAPVFTALFVYGLTSAIMIINFAGVYYGGPLWMRALQY